MSEMHESYARAEDDHRGRANDRFLPFEPEEIRTEYEERSLTDTNNLKLFLRDVSPGVIDSHDYRRRDFAAVIDAFRTDQPELWDAVQYYRTAKDEAEKTYRQKMNDLDPRAEEYGEMAYQLNWGYIKALNDAYDALAPMLETAGLDPLVVCI